jgi:hypothetical protein
MRSINPGRRATSCGSSELLSRGFIADSRRNQSILKPVKQHGCQVPTMLNKETVRWVFVWLFFVPPCLAQTAGGHPVTNDSLAVRQSDQACLSEILISAPQSDSPAQITEARHKAERLRKAVLMGGSLSDLARANSQAPTARGGGALGCSSGVSCPSNLKGESFGCMLVRCPKCFTQNRVLSF